MEALLSLDGAAEDASCSALSVCPARLRVASRTAAPVSNVCSFQADLLQDGCIVIQQVGGGAGESRSLAR